MRDLLFVDEIKEYVQHDSLYNGLQTFEAEQVRKVGFGVSASVELLKMAVAQGCDALVVHHGVSIDEKKLDRFAYGRLSYAIKNNVALYSAHYILDAHPDLGNNAQILKTLGVKKSALFYGASYPAPWGRMGDLPQPVSLNDVMTVLRPLLSPATVVYDFGPTQISRVVSVSGDGSPSEEDVELLLAAGVDLFITGEVHEWIREMCREAGLNLIGGGHYHTEMFGVKALQQVMESEWGLETVWLDLENEV